ncbi:MAG: DUF4097 family beta strand repeat-containing protein [Dehalococcoidia bacterium]|nr:DUF4097 family beta strand repeat-containing protein [Dehalococcoidia bacterium]
MRKRAADGRDETAHVHGRREKPWVQHIRTPMSPVSVLLTGVILLVIGVLLLACSACTTKSAVRTESNDFPVGDSVTLVVKSLGGRIEVEAGTDNVVCVRAELRDIRRIKYEAIQSGDEIVVTAEKTGTWWFPAGNTRADIYVTAPASTSLRLETRNGRIEVRGTTRGGILNTSNGAIVLEDVKGDFEATTSNGAVEIDTIDGSAFVRSSNGKITLEQAAGEFNVKTTNGDISFSGHMTPGGSNRLVTTNGRVEVELTGVASVSIDASTGNGEINHRDVPILTTTAKTDHVIGTVGAGEADLYIETSNGDVIIK